MSDVLQYVSEIERLCRKIRDSLGEVPLFESPPSANPLTEAEVDRQWADMQAMGTAFGAKWHEKAGPARRSLIKRTLREHPGPFTLIRALRGFLRLSADWTPEIKSKAFTPEYVLRPTKIEGHLEAGEERTWTRVSAQAETTRIASAVVDSLAEAESLRKSGTFGSIGG